MLCTDGVSAVWVDREELALAEAVLRLGIEPFCPGVVRLGKHLVPPFFELLCGLHSHLGVHALLLSLENGFADLTSRSPAGKVERIVRMFEERERHTRMRAHTERWGQRATKKEEEEDDELGRGKAWLRAENAG